jgi:hypothetical protein
MEGAMPGNSLTQRRFHFCHAFDYQTITFLGAIHVQVKSLPHEHGANVTLAAMAPHSEHP